LKVKIAKLVRYEEVTVGIDEGTTLVALEATRNATALL
jgi:hypothetical protein